MKKFVITSMLLLTCILSYSYDACIDGIYYNFNNNEAIVTYLKKNSSNISTYTDDVTIPSTVTYNGITYTVTSIGESAFAWCSNLSSIDIPSSVTNIGNDAFYKCSNLSTFTIPSSVSSIGNDAFQMCSSLTSIIIPSNVASIGNYAFSDCISLKSLTISEGVTNIEDGAFCGCTELKEIVLPSTLQKITSICFSNCGLESVVIPEGVQTIEGAAFGDCYNLKSIYISKTVTDLAMGNGPFMNCPNIEEIKVEEGNPMYDSRNNCNAIIAQPYPYSSGDASACERIFLGCKNTVIPDDIYCIGDNAFSGCCGLPEELIIPDQISIIGMGAFEKSDVRKVVLGSNLWELGYFAFGWCYGLEEVEVKNPLMRIKARAFEDTPWLNNQPDGPVYIGRSLYTYKGDASEGTKLELPSWCRNVSDNAMLDINWNGKSGISELVVNDSLEYIGEYAFHNCPDLQKVTLQSKVGLWMGDLAFAYSGLKELIIKDDKVNISATALDNCSNLQTITCYSMTPPYYATSSQFGYINTDYFSQVTLYVYESAKADYESQEPWNCFNIQTMPDPFYVIYDDKELTNDTIEEYMRLTYNRYFDDTNWEALYIPFKLSYSDWADDFYVYRINDVHQYDTDDDGIMDKTELEICKVKSGSIDANTPYVIKAKGIGEKSFVLSDAILYKTEEKSYDVTSWNTKFTFTGTYHTITSQTLIDNGYYTLEDGALLQSTIDSDDLNPFRWYISVTDRSGVKQEINSARIEIRCLDDEVTGVNDVIEKNQQNNIYDLSGRKISNLKIKKSTICVKEGKKYVVK